MNQQCWAGIQKPPNLKKFTNKRQKWVVEFFLKISRMYLLNNMFYRLHYATLKSITRSIVQWWKRLISKTMEFMNFRAWKSPNAFITRIVCSIFSKVIVFEPNNSPIEYCNHSIALLFLKNWDILKIVFQTAKILHYCNTFLKR